MTERTWRIEVATRPELLDPAGEAVRSDVEDLGVTDVTAVRFVRVTFVRTALAKAAVRRIATELLADPICDVCAVDAHVVGEKGTVPFLKGHKKGTGPEVVSVIEVVRKPGVMDPVEASTL
ncbi:MAG TPA: phosphoribosylformylglycinamidine synthase subunit PurS, partial [Planctomycetota bacterium]|nr:phosphoribosylformylglycinamidine synthase subunit PurS [Planctomycetota bacterium]